MGKTRKIRCYINGEYCFTTTKFSSQKALKNHLRSVKHIGSLERVSRLKNTKWRLEA